MGKHCTRGILSVVAAVLACLEFAYSVSVCRANYKRAVEELTALLRQAYVQHADKTIQELIFEDVLLAVRLCSRSLSCHRQVLISLFAYACMSDLHNGYVNCIVPSYKTKCLHSLRAPSHEHSLCTLFNRPNQSFATYVGLSAIGKL